jgi:anti-anti-sigma regulatory factor
VTLKIETHRHGNATILRLIGRVRAEHVHELEHLIVASDADISLDLEQVTLVDADVIKFLATCATRVIPLLNCPGYITDWIAKEQEPNA